MARGKHPHAHRTSNALRFPASGQMALYVFSPSLPLQFSKPLDGQFIACTSPNNAASIIAATGIQTDIANNCTSLGDTPFPFPTVNNTTPGDGGNDTAPGVNYQPNCSDQGTSSLPGQVITSTPITTAQPTLTLPPTTTTLSPEQALSSISLLSVNGQNLPPSVPSVVNLGGNTNGAPSVILLTSRPTPSPSK
jgi:hypothetical protein